MADTHHGQDRPDRLEEACTTLAVHIRAGQPAHVEDYLRLHPDLAADADSVLELIYTEFLARHARGDDVPPDEWYRRFPHLGARLDRLFLAQDLVYAGFVSHSISAINCRILQADRRTAPRMLPASVYGRGYFPCTPGRRAVKCAKEG